MAGKPREDSFSAFDDTLNAPLTDPWRHSAGEPEVHQPDYELLQQLLTIPIRARATTQSGNFANGVDSWIAQELRRAGFGPDEVWPRATRPRVLPRDIATLLQRLPPALRRVVADKVATTPQIAPVDARILGRAYEKQVDVCLTRWDRGPEILISTKAQLSSFGKNLPNRFEEAYGDAGNLRGRYPLTAVGYFFVQRSTIRDTEPDAWERSIDMMRKLRDTGDGNGYTVTGLLLVEWDDTAEEPAVTARHDLIPTDLAPPQFFTNMIKRVLAAAPVSHHVQVRQQIERRNIPITEVDPLS